MKLPPSDSIFGTNPSGAYQRFLDAPETAEPPTQPQEIPTPELTLDSMLGNPAEWILLPGKQHATYEYPDLLLGMHRLGCDVQVEQAAQKLGFKVQNTATEQNGREYIGNITWEQGLKLNLLLGNFTMTPRQFVDFHLLLKEGVQGKREVYNGADEQIDIKTLQNVHDEIFGLRAPERAEWLDASFEEVMGLFLNYQHIIDDGDGTLKPQRSDPIETQGTLDYEGYVNLRYTNYLGLPIETKRHRNSEEIYYLPSRRDSAIVLLVLLDRSVDSYKVWLRCDWCPSIVDEALGVRPVRLYQPSK